MDEKSTGARIKAFFLDTIFPRSCLGCEKLLPVSSTHRYLCETCFTLIRPVTESRCPFCQNATILGATCAHCRPDHALDRLLVAAYYEERMVKLLVKALKYRFATESAQDIGSVMADYLDNRGPMLDILTFRNIVVVPIPLHKRRQRWRGFNQAELIARVIAEKLSLPLRTDLLIRPRHKEPQADIKDKKDREKNAKGIFTISPSAPPLTVRGGWGAIVIDDVATTGATMDDAARVLKSAGAKQVIGFVFARGG